MKVLVELANKGLGPAGAVQALDHMWNQWAGLEFGVADDSPPPTPSRCPNVRPC